MPMTFEERLLSTLFYIATRREVIVIVFARYVFTKCCGSQWPVFKYFLIEVGSYCEFSVRFIIYLKFKGSLDSKHVFICLIYFI